MNQRIMKLGFLILSTVLTMASCAKDELEFNAMAESEDYVTLNLDITSSRVRDEEARLYHYGGSSPSTIEVYLGNDGDRIPMRTNVYKGGSVTTQPIYSAVHDWVIENNGRTARYKGKIKILRGQLENIEFLHISAVPDRVGSTIGISSLMLLPEDKATAIDLNVPLVMVAPLVRTGDTIKNDFANTLVPESSWSLMHKFNSTAPMVQISIVNKLNRDIQLDQAVLKPGRSQYGEPKVVYVRRQYDPTSQTPAYTRGILERQVGDYVVKPTNGTSLKIPANSTRRAIFFVPQYDNTLSEVALTIAGRSVVIPIEELPIRADHAQNSSKPRLYPYTVTIN